MSISDRMKRTSNCVAINIDNKESFEGDLYNCFQEEPIRFCDVHDFFIIVNSLLDTIEYPAQKVKYRAFKKTLPTLKLIDVRSDEKLFDTDVILDKCKTDAYVIMVTSRDNATWQGKLYKQSEDKEFSFNSEVELIRLLK
ncbi:MAG: hypothetical protein K5883_00100 [Pseudobutyrivibrio sp.]|nr:hypothetical protein [Pseudobutyrivibrio sp.]